MGEVDVTFRRLLRGLPRPLLQLAFPGRELEPAGPPLDASVDRTRQLTTDNLFRVRDRAGAADASAEALVHVEIERDWRPQIPRRLFGYASAAVTATDLPVWSVVVLLRPGGQPPGDAVHRVPGADGDAFVFRYQVLPLWQLDAQQMRALLGPQGAPFCAAMRGADEAFVAALADEVRTSPRLRKRDRKTTMQLLLLVSAAILGDDAARRIFHVESLIQDPNVQSLIREWEARGQAKEARALLQRVLAVRGIPLSRETRRRITAEQDHARLVAWLEAAATAQTIDDVFRERPARRGSRRAAATSGR